MKNNNIVKTVFIKELTDLFRDKKTIISSILIPLILFPIIFGVMGIAMNKTQNQAQKNIKVSITDKSNSSLGTFLKSQKNIKIVHSDDISKDVKDGKILLAIDIPENFNTNIGSESTAGINITYDNSSEQAGMAFDIINSYIDAFSKQIVAQRLAEKNINTEILNPIKINKNTIEKKDSGEAKMLLSIMLPLILTIYCVAGPIAPAVDLGAGEKERGTLEPLLTTQANRLSLLAGKFLAITVIGMLTTLASIAGILIAMVQKNSFFGSSASSLSGISLTAPSFVLIALITLLLTMAFGALELSISIFARSFKEAQTYLSPLTIVAFIPIYGTFMLDPKNLSLVYFNIPLANASCLMKEAISGIFNPVHIGITFVWAIIYIILSILFARFNFNREEVIFRA